MSALLPTARPEPKPLSALVEAAAGDPALAGIEVRDITADSRQAAPGVLFAALPGTVTDGARFAADAVRGGAVAVLAGREAALPPDLGVPIVRVEDPRHALARAAARLYGRQPEMVAAVTGTSGKTSVAAFLRQIWEADGRRAASVGTLGVVTAGQSVYGSLTTPNPVALAGLLAALAESHVTHVAMEASSHGLDQRRLDGVRISAGAFTNLSRDHLDYHPTVEAYLAAKLRLFDTLLPAGAPAVVDPEEPGGACVVEAATRRGLTLFTVGRRGEALRLIDVTPDGFTQRMRIDAGAGPTEVRLPLAGAFQVANALIAAGLAIATGTPAETALLALERLKGAPGRLEKVGASGKGALIFVDYAHKPAALESALAALRPATRGRLIVVFGAGGDRDPGKRPLMGEVARRCADLVIVTDDNPRSEDPAAIRAAILAGCPEAIEIGDRAEAIRAGIALLEEGDVLLIAGKGHETGQIVGDRVLPFSDHEVVAAALASGGPA